MKCTKCGTENTAGYKFCIKCGNPLQQAAAPQPGPGEAQKIICSKCGSEVKAGTKFCSKCGTPVPPAGTPTGGAPVSAGGTPVPPAGAPTGGAPVPPTGAPAGRPVPPVPPTGAPAGRPVPPVPPAGGAPAGRPVPPPPAGGAPAGKPMESQEEKSGKGLKIALIIAVIALVIVVAVTIVFAWKNDYLVGLFPDKTTEETEEKEDDEEAEESEEAEEGEESEEAEAEADPALAEGDALVAEGKLLEAVDKYAEVAENSADYATARTKMAEALATYVTNSKNDAQTQADGELYAEALAALDDALAKVNEKLAAYPDLTVDTTDLPYKASEIEAAYTEFVNSRVYRYLGNGQLTESEDILIEAATLMDGRAETEFNIPVKVDFVKKYHTAYAQVVSAKVGNWLQNAGTDYEKAADDVLNYFDEVDNNCWIVEYYEHLSAEAGKSYAVPRVNGDYVIADSDTRELTSADLDALSSEEVRIARYEIYARHGKDFTDPSVNSYFQGKSWYNFTTSYAEFDEYSLSDIELYNRDFIIQYEISMGYIE